MELRPVEGNAAAVMHLAFVTHYFNTCFAEKRNVGQDTGVIPLFFQNVP